MNMETLSVTRNHQIGINEILYLQGISNYTIIHTRDKQQTIAAQTLHLVHASINYESFVRINRSFILNMKYLSAYSVEDNKLIFKLSNGQKFIASRRRTKNCMDKLSRKKIYEKYPI